MSRLALALIFLTLSACTLGTPNKVRVATVKTPGPQRLVETSPGPSPIVPPTGFASPSPSPSAKASPSPAPAPAPSPTGSASGSLPTSPTPTPTASPVLSLVAGSQPNDTWLAGPTLQRPRAGHVAGAIKGELLVLEGSHTPSMEILSVEAPDWRLNAGYDTDDVPEEEGLDNGRSLLALAVSDTRLFAGAGRSSIALASVNEYSPQGLEPDYFRLPSPVVAPAATFADGMLIFAGGVNALDEVLEVVQRLRIADGVTSNGVEMPLGVAGAAYATLDGKLYVFGGYTLNADGDPVPQDAVQIYDMTADKWRFARDGQAGAPPPLPQGRHSGAAAALNGKLYVVGGVGTGSGLIDAVAVYDPKTNTWSEGAAIPTARALLALAAYDGRLWAIGGRGADKRPLASVEIYRP